MPSKPLSQPLITMPCPSVNEKGVPRSTLESNLDPSVSMPYTRQQQIQGAAKSSQRWRGSLLACAPDAPCRPGKLRYYWTVCVNCWPVEPGAVLQQRPDGRTADFVKPHRVMYVELVTILGLAQALLWLVLHAPAHCVACTVSGQSSELLKSCSRVTLQS